MSGKVDLKVVLLGKAYAGKTSLVERFIHDRFSGDSVPYQNTIGAAYGSRRIEVYGKPLTLGIWDTAGSERYEAMSRIYYRGARAAILCYDLTDKSSFDRIRFWIGELRANEEECKIYLCATKKDLIDNDPGKRAVNERVVKSLADDVQSPVFESSSKTGECIHDLFMTIARDFMKVTRNDEKDSNVIHIGGDKHRDRKCFLHCND